MQWDLIHQFMQMPAPKEVILVKEIHIFFNVYMYNFHNKNIGLNFPGHISEIFFASKTPTTFHSSSLLFPNCFYCE